MRGPSCAFVRVWEAVGAQGVSLSGPGCLSGAAPQWVDRALLLPDGEGARRPGVACWPPAVLGTSGQDGAPSSGLGDLFPVVFSLYLLPQLGPWGSGPQKRDLPPTTRRASGCPSRARALRAALRCLLSAG